MTFVVVGDTNADINGSLDAFPKEGDDTTVRDPAWSSGGSAANVAVGLGKLGARARLVSRVGVDPAAEIALTEAREAGVDLTHVQRDPSAPTGLCFAAISPNGERTLFGFRGANPRLEQVDPSVLDGATWLHINGHALLEAPQIESVMALVGHAAQRGVSISLDLCMPLARGPGRGALERLGRSLAVLFGNREELALVRDHLPELVPVIEKRGAEGACVRLVGGAAHVAPGHAVRALDTTACGDAFVAAFLYARSGESSLLDAARVGNAAGAYTAMRYGAAASMPTLDGLRRVLDNQPTDEAQDALAALARCR